MNPSIVLLCKQTGGGVARGIGGQKNGVNALLGKNNIMMSMHGKPLSGSAVVR